MSDEERITREALNRLEGNAKERERAIDRSSKGRDRASREWSELQFTEIRRRLGDLNNSHNKAVEEKKRTDEAALQVQERTVTRIEFQVFKDGINEQLATARGVATATAKGWAIVTAVAMALFTILANIVIRKLAP